MSRPTPPTCKTGNWPSDNKALKRRGSLAIWFDPAMTWEAAPSGKRGRQRDYSDAAIQTCLTMKVLFGMALRQTTGFVESQLRLVGLDWTVPDFSTLSRRHKTLKVLALQEPRLTRPYNMINPVGSGPDLRPPGGVNIARR
ncbi:transposase [Pseudomonas sp. GX19020]|uniref:transposase n=1 Tax=Pseudomonas sp. GX19020 TaxID=2942277 RepID=UPI0032D5798A